jgi:bifunctional non-homologous end joining protein LigD
MIDVETRSIAHAFSHITVYTKIANAEFERLHRIVLTGLQMGAPGCKVRAVDKAFSRAHILIMKETRKLREYREKRDFHRTPEPAGKTKPALAGPIFVIQRHDARKDHYDLRLQINDVLKSWAVPKGPSFDPNQKRLAVATEDHPLEYAKFEGMIPKGEYGAGKVLVWDTGRYVNVTQKRGKLIPVEEAIEHGHLSVWLEGQKIRGGFALNRFHRDRQEQWLLVKLKDEQADPDYDPLTTQPQSVLTGRKIESIGANGQEEIRKAVSLAKKLADQKQRKPEAMPAHLEPMLALLSNIPSDAEEYAFEYKWDGVRALFYWDGKQTRIEGRNELDVTHRWPELTKLGENFGSTPAILDGEIIALDSKNRPSFQLLAQRMHLSSKPTATQMRAVPIVYMIFDILYLKDRVLMPIPYLSRRAILEALKLSDDYWQTPPALRENPKDVLKAALQNRLEGLVAKKLDSSYLPGHRTRDWLKIKAVNRQEFVIGGWIPVKSSAKAGIGALLTGFYDRPDHLVFAGKVGTGFTDAVRKELKEQFRSITRSSSPFANTVPEKEAIFLEPKIVAEIEFREWTQDGKLRHPSFKGLREDKDPRDVARETPV